MDSIIKVVIALLIFAAGFTLGQGHGVLDYNGDGHVTKADFRAATDKIWEK